MASGPLVQSAECAHDILLCSHLPSIMTVRACVYERMPVQVGAKQLLYYEITMYENVNELKFCNTAVVATAAK